MCTYSGKALNPKYKFSISHVPDRCSVIVYGCFLIGGTANEKDKSNYGRFVLYIVSFCIRCNDFISSKINNVNDCIPENMIKVAIESLVNAGKTVYVFVAVEGLKWTDVFNYASDKHIASLKVYVEKLQVKGVILDDLEIYVSHVLFC